MAVQVGPMQAISRTKTVRTVTIPSTANSEEVVRALKAAFAAMHHRNERWLLIPNHLFRLRNTDAFRAVHLIFSGVLRTWKSSLAARPSRPDRMGQDEGIAEFPRPLRQPMSGPVDYEVIAEEACSGIGQQLIRYGGSEGDPIPAYLCFPKDQGSPRGRWSITSTRRTTSPGRARSLVPGDPFAGIRSRPRTSRRGGAPPDSICFEDRSCGWPRNVADQSGLGTTLSRDGRRPGTGHHLDGQGAR